ncbi:MAG: hypothetical protein KC466_01015 [Myxococcales bacterium]|nr:hypothetical protein [Myxococcales bacterium]
MGLGSAATKGRVPFAGDDATAGSENELQTAVIGTRDAVDLPQAIERSNYFADLRRRVAAGDMSRSLVTDVERFLTENRERVWENSWVRFRRAALSPSADALLRRDLLADKRDPASGPRSDAERFAFEEGGESWVRVPVSYLLRVALADAVEGAPAALAATGARLLDHFISDNTSPETTSFHVVGTDEDGRGLGRAVAREAALRFLLTQALVAYANGRFGLIESGQRVVVYPAANVPGRIRALNGCISDAFYRELFMSPCLAGWDRGEDKQRYMHLCHQVLSRSQLNAVLKLREAGVIANNVVVLPNPSNASLANNGVHLSLGSRRLTALRAAGGAFGAREEKYVGDLVIKIVEHFLPLFVGAYSAAPYRLAFEDFHPERALGFMTHQLDYTHVRMLWRRWRKKANLRVFGRPITPFGPVWLDRAVRLGFGLRGDFVPDWRLTDYFAWVMSTERGPALDGTLGNVERLKADLGALGVFDPAMSIYLAYRLREFSQMGFCGFEGRHYSLFHGLDEDFGRAADLQCLVTALAWRYVMEGKVRHADIPDRPEIESERRQVFFGAAIGVPTFFVSRETKNRFLGRILALAERARASRRYPGSVRVHNLEYRRALLHMIRRDAPDLIESMGLQETVRDLEDRLDDPKGRSAAGKLTGVILGELGARDPMAVPAGEFNAAADRAFRTTLREAHLREGVLALADVARKLDSETIAQLGEGAVALAARSGALLLDEHADADALRRLILICLAAVEAECRRHGRPKDEPNEEALAHDASICRAEPARGPRRAAL